MLCIETQYYDSFDFNFSEIRVDLLCQKRGSRSAIGLGELHRTWSLVLGQRLLKLQVIVMNDFRVDDL